MPQSSLCLHFAKVQGSELPELAQEHDGGPDQQQETAAHRQGCAAAPVGASAAPSRAQAVTPAKPKPARHSARVAAAKAKAEQARLAQERQALGLQTGASQPGSTSTGSGCKLVSTAKGNIHSEPAATPEASIDVRPQDENAPTNVKSCTASNASRRPSSPALTNRTLLGNGINGHQP